MTIYIGGQPNSDVRIGTIPVQKVMVGTQLAWQRWTDAVIIDELNDGGPSSGAGLDTYFDKFGSRGVNSFQALNQVVAGDVNTNNVRNYGYLYSKAAGPLRTNSFTIGFQIGDAVNSGLETRLYVGRKMTSESSNQPPTVRATYLDCTSGNSYFRSTNASGTQTSATLTSGASPVNTQWEIRITGNSWAIYKNGVLNSTRIDPNGAMPLDGSVYVGFAICSDRNAFGTRGWGSRVNRWYFMENGYMS